MMSPQDKCLNYSLQCLARRELTVDMLRKKLIKKEYTEDIIQAVLEICISRNYVSDTRFVECYIRSTLRLKDVGPKKMQNYTCSKGISRDVFYAVWNSMNIAQIDHAKKALEKKLSQFELPLTNTDKQKITRFLLHRGFDFNIALQALKLV
jgi:regulatory protein